METFDDKSEGKMSIHRLNHNFGHYYSEKICLIAIQ